MNVREYLLEHGADGDLAVAADLYLKAALELPDAERHAALIPSVRSMVSTVASSLRKAQRGSGPAQACDDSQGRDGGPVQAPDDSQRADGGPAQAGHDSQDDYGGPADPILEWAAGHQDATYWIPGTGRRKLPDITAEEWDRRAELLENQSRGVLRAAGEARGFAALIRRAGATCLGDLL